MTQTTLELTAATERKVFAWQMLFFAVLLTVSSINNTYTVLADRAREGDYLPFWEPLVWEASSHVLILLLIPALGWWLHRFPLTRDGWRRSLPAHALATVPFSLIHTFGMVLLRKLAYALVGERYDFGPPWTNWLYEYRKDCYVYALLVVALLGFRVYGLWLDARAGQKDHAFLAHGNAAQSETERKRTPAEERLDRLVVRKRNREFILDAADIDQIEADGNYVIVHSSGETYRLRESLEALAGRLGEARFARVHRAHAVNIDRIREIQPWDHGDYRILLKDGSFVNFSRRYRSRLSHLFR